MLSSPSQARKKSLHRILNPCSEAFNPTPPMMRSTKSSRPSEENPSINSSQKDKHASEAPHPQLPPSPLRRRRLPRRRSNSPRRRSNSPRRKLKSPPRMRKTPTSEISSDDGQQSLFKSQPACLTAIQTYQAAAIKNYAFCWSEESPFKGCLSLKTYNVIPIIRQRQDMKSQSEQHVIIIGGGFSGLTAANQILKKKPKTKITVLQANDYLGGRSKSIVLNGCTFDQGAEFIGSTQHHVIQLAIQSKNELVPVESKGTKIIEFKDGLGTYTSNIPDKVNILALLQLQWCIWKINRMAKKVPTLNPGDCELGHKWDSITLQSWLDQNVWFTKLKVMVEAAIRVILGVELCEVSLLYFLYYVNQSKDFDNLINVENGLQEKKTKLGTQHMSIYLGEQIKSKGGVIRLNFYVKSIVQTERGCTVFGENGQQVKGDYLVIAMPPCNANKIHFTPQLSTQRRLICERSFMGTLIKVILLYKEKYWKNINFSGETLSDCYDSPVMNGFDDSRANDKGEIQPALIVFVGGGIYRYWKNRENFKEAIVGKLAKYFKQPEMLNPIAVHWNAWDEVRSIGGAPVSPFSPGTLSQVEDLRRPEGRIHWAGTEMATISTGFMDGAIESGKRVANEIIDRMSKITVELQQVKDELKSGFSYTKYNRGKKKWLQWW